jgi:hypothetical protein
MGSNAVRGLHDHCGAGTRAGVTTAADRAMRVDEPAV